MTERQKIYYFFGAGPKRQERMDNVNLKPGDPGWVKRYPKLAERPKKEKIKRAPRDKSTGITPTASSVRVALKGGHITADQADDLNPKHSEPPVKRVRKKSPPKPSGEVTEEVRNGRTYKVTRLPDYTPAQLEAARKKADVRGTFRNRKEGKVGR